VDPDCIFCAIVAGRAPASVVHDDDATLAFLDLHPVTPGHLLVIPKGHAAGLAELDPAAGARLFVVGQRLAAALRASGLRCAGVNLFLADGAAAGQEVFHVHLHVFPRFAGDAFGPGRPFRVGPAALRVGGDPSRADLDAVAAQIRRASDTIRGDDRRTV
jgi:diadenosine tetraphosphate (Ap4A) HIT family hydrolase